MDRRTWKPFKFSRESPSISHICFADDMLLFVEASELQMQKVLNYLNWFCDASGQEASVRKTKTYFSKRVSNSLVNTLSYLNKFAMKDHGKYLGVPLLHQKITKRTYNYVIENLHKN